MPLEVESRHRTDSENQANIYYDIAIRNSDVVTHVLRKCRVDWIYYPGSGFGGGYGDILVAARPYVFDLQLETKAWGQGGLSADRWFRSHEPIRQQVELDPALEVQPFNTSGTVANLSIQLHYSFIGAANSHGQFEWNFC